MFWVLSLVTWYRRPAGHICCRSALGSMLLGHFMQHSSNVLGEEKAQQAKKPGDVSSGPRVEREVIPQLPLAYYYACAVVHSCNARVHV